MSKIGVPSIRSAPDTWSTGPRAGSSSTRSSRTEDRPRALGRKGDRVANTPMRVLPPSRGGRTVGRQLVPSCPACTTVENCHTSQI